METKEVKRKYFTVAEVLKSVVSRYVHAKKRIDAIGVRVSETSSQFKKLLTLCNSLEIIFMQYDLTQPCLKLQKIAADCNEFISSQGSTLDKLWQPRILSFINSAFLYSKLGMFDESLKELYIGHGILQLIKDSGGIPDYDITIPLNLLTFFVLWRLKRVKNAQDYLDLADLHFRMMMDSSKAHKLIENNAENIFSILTACKACVIVYKKKNSKRPISLLEEALLRVGKNSVARRLLKDLLKNIYKTSGKDDSFLKNSDFENSLSQDPEKSDFYNWLLSKSLENIFFVSCFVPHIAENTPLIRVAELEKGRYKENTQDYIESSYPDTYQPTKFSTKHYNKFLKSLLSSYNSKFIKDPANRNHGVVIRPQSPLKQIKQKKINGTNRATLRGFKSEPRGVNPYSQIGSGNFRMNEKNRKLHRRSDFDYDLLTQKINRRMEQKTDFQPFSLEKKETRSKLSKGLFSSCYIDLDY